MSEQITEGGYTRKRIPESAWPEHLRDQRIASLEAERDRYREALELIAATDPVDAALDPDRALRVAREALNGGTE